MTEVTPQKREPFGPRKQAIFIDNIRKYGSVYFACKQANVSRTEVYRTRDSDPDFKAAWEAAKEDALDLLEASAHKRAHNASDTLLIFLLKAGRPEKYREPVQRFAQTDSDGNDITDTERAARVAALFDAARARRAGQPDEAEGAMAATTGTSDMGV